MYNDCMSNRYEMPNEVEVMVPEKAIHKVAQIYTEHLMQPGNAEALISEALERIGRKEKNTINANEVRIAALERVAEDNGGVLPEGSLRDLYKEKVIEEITEIMCAEPYDPTDPERVVEYYNKPQQLLIAHEPFRVMFSGEINKITKDILGDERLAFNIAETG